jgi:hypothetical protein
MSLLGRPENMTPPFVQGPLHLGKDRLDGIGGLVEEGGGVLIFRAFLGIWDQKKVCGKSQPAHSGDLESADEQEWGW